MSSASSTKSSGSWWKSFLNFFGLFKQEARLIVVGLDNSGKTTIVNHLKPERQASFEVVPTIGFSLENFDLGKIHFTVADMSGAGTYRSLWETYYKNVSGIVFVVDSSDKLRMCVAKDELDLLLSHNDIKTSVAPILVFANKSDLPGALEAADVSLYLGLPQLSQSQRPWQIQASNALSGEGVGQGLEWLVQVFETTTKNATRK
jgi:ADP-ribosylation factor-like protein 6